MKGDQTLFVLNALENKSLTSGDLLAHLFDGDYKDVYREMKKSLGHQGAVKRISLRYHNFVYKMKRDGLLGEEKTSDGVKYFLSSRGEKKLLELKSRLSLPASRGYKKEEGSGYAIVAFDIPEKERKKRDWLRGVLRNLGMTMIQRSVWIGKIKLPLALLQDLQKMKLMGHVEVFQITKTGSLKQLHLE